MSSFRPDIDSTAHVFVPNALAAGDWSSEIDGVEDPKPAAIVESALESEALRAGNEGVDTTSVPSPEEIALLEQAAFERGAASVQIEAEAVARLSAGLEEAMGALRTASASAVAESRGLVLDLARDLARHWVQGELSSESEIFAAYLDRAMDGLETTEATRLHLAESDLETLGRHAPDALSRWAAAGLAVEADAALEPGSFRLRAPTGGIEGGLDSIADRLRAAMDEAVGREEEEATE